jgi:hypothetical protein
MEPTYFHPFDNSKSNQWRLDELFKFVDHKDKPRLIQAYFQTIDDAVMEIFI